MRSAFDSNERDSSRRTVSINTSLMWEVLDYTNVDTRRKHASGGTLFHESLCPTTDAADEEDDTVETQIFHSSTREVDTSDGGQALPPFSDHVVRRTTYPRTSRGRNEQQAEWLLPDPAMASNPAVALPPGGNQNMAGPPQGQGPPPPGAPQYAPWLGAFTGNASIMDITHDPFMQFQDSGSPYFGMWEVGNL